MSKFEKPENCEECQKARYCALCGEKLILKIHIVQRYDTYTGEEMNYHHHAWKCPRSRWWNGHSDFSEY